MKILNEAGIILILIFTLIGCDRGQKMLGPVMQEPSSQPTEQIVDKPPIQEVEIEVHPGFFHTIETFTNADAALESQQFQKFLEDAREYNAEWCDKLERLIGASDDNLFEFTNEQAADEFLTQSTLLYSQDIKPAWGPKRPATDTVPSWGIWLAARCE